MPCVFISHIFTLVVGNVKDPHFSVNSELVLFHSCLVITVSPEVNFLLALWSFILYTCRLVLSSQFRQTPKQISRLFLCVSPSSLVVCPMNPSHLKSPKSDISPQFNNTSRPCLDSPSLCCPLEIVSRLKAEVTVGLISFFSLLYETIVLCYLLFNIWNYCYFVFTFLVVYGGNRACYCLMTRSVSSNQNLLSKESLRTQHHFFLHSICTLPFQHVNFIISIITFATFSGKAYLSWTPQRHHFSDVE